MNDGLIPTLFIYQWLFLPIRNASLPTEVLRWRALQIVATLALLSMDILRFGKKNATSFQSLIALVLGWQPRYHCHRPAPR
jgi:hypothetical protein